MAKNKPIRTIMIAGGCGFIGTNIALECIRRGYDPFIVDNLSRPGSEYNEEMLTSMGIRVQRADVRNLEDLVFDRDTSAIIHLAGNVGIGLSLSSPYLDFKQNAVSTVHLLEYARKFGVPFIYASTNKVYSSAVNDIEVKEERDRYIWPDVSGVTEDYRTDGAHHTPYGVSKLTGDMYCQEYFHSFGVPTVVNRMSCIYGLHQNGHVDQGWVDHFVRANMYNAGDIDIFGDGKQVRDVLWGEDVARLYLDEIEQIDKCAGEVFNVGGGPKNTMSLLECMSRIEKETDMTFTPKFMEWRPADQKVYISDITKVCKLLNWKPTVAPQEGIGRMVSYYKEKYATTRSS